MRILNVTTGKTYLFQSTLPELRKKLKNQPSIEAVEISRIIPDTLVIDINERIPQAFLHWRNNSKVVDAKGVLMSTASCVSVGGDLPVITGFLSKKENLIPGSQLPQVMPAMKLIESAANIVPEMRFLRISLNNPRYFQTIIRVDGTRKNYKLFISKKGVEVKLHALKPLLARISSSHPKATTIDMRYKGQAVVK
jgi:cell division septal protein FtsQ